MDRHRHAGRGPRDKDPKAPGKAAAPRRPPPPAAGKPAPGKPAPGKPSTPKKPARDTGHWLWGHHAVLAALGNPERRCLQLLATAQDAGQLGPRLAQALTARGLLPETAPKDLIDRVLPAGAVHQGVALRVEPLAELDIEDSCSRAPDERAIVVVLDQVTDPHNVGAVMRSAAAFGAKAVVVTDRHAPGATGVLAKAACGALDLIPLVRVVNLARALDTLGELGYWRIALDAAGTAPLSRTDTSGAVALVLGAEGEGLRRLTRERCDVMARLPIGNTISSLNVSNAAAIALYELVRDR